MTKVLDKQKRFDYLLQLVLRERDLDVLNRYAVDDYVKHTGADFQVMFYGANKCKLMGRDLSAMCKLGYLRRYACGLQGMAGMGFPRWVWSYKMEPLGYDRLAELGDTQ